MKKLTVDGITFETTKEAKAAERELEAIEKIRGRMDVTNPIYAKVLHEKLIEKEMLHTKVGDKFLAELQGYYAPETVKETSDAAETPEVPETQSGADATELSDAERAEAKRDRDEADIPYLNEAPRAEAAEMSEDRENRGEGRAEPEASAEPEMSDAPEAEMPEERGERTDYADDIRFSLDFDEPSSEDAQKEPPVERSQEEQDGKAAVGSDTARLEGILSGVIFDEEDLIPIGESSEAAELDALMEEYGLTDDAEPETESAGETGPEEDEETGMAELDALMAEYGLADDAEPEMAAEPKTGDSPAEEEDGKSDTPEPDFEDKWKIDSPEEDAGAQEPDEAAEPEEDEEISVAELDALMEEQSQTETAETPLDLDVNVENDEEVPGTEEDRFRLDLDDENLFGDEPDDATLLAQARTLKKELHQEDLSEVFSDREEQPAGRKRFSLYGVLLLSILLNVVLIVSMVIMVRVFKDSDNRNILNYERILEQEYQTEQTATPTDAE